MSKKVKCVECHNSIHWAVPNEINEDNYEYAKYCIKIAKTSIVCGETMKTKSVNHEQYCKKFLKKTEIDLETDSYYQKEISELEKMIKEYEKKKMYRKLKINLQFLGEHECEPMQNLNNVAIEKYLINGVTNWYHHLILENQNEKLNAILYCPYCGERLER